MSPQIHYYPRSNVYSSLEAMHALFWLVPTSIKLNPAPIDFKFQVPKSWLHTGCLIRSLVATSGGNSFQLHSRFSELYWRDEWRKSDTIAGNLSLRHSGRIPWVIRPHKSWWPMVVSSEALLGTLTSWGGLCGSGLYTATHWPYTRNESMRLDLTECVTAGLMSSSASSITDYQKSNHGIYHQKALKASN